MGKRLLIFAIFFLSLLAFTIWLAQPPFRLQRKLLAKLPYEPYMPYNVLNVLITDLDDDGHPEVTAIFRDIFRDKPPIWVRFPFDKPSTLRFENCWAIWMREQRCQFVLKALPVLTADGRLRLLRWKDEKAKLEPLPNLPDVPMEDAFIDQGAGMETVFLDVYRGENVWVFILSPQGEWQFASRFTSQAMTLLIWTGMAFWMPFAFNGIQANLLGFSGEGRKERRQIWALGCAMVLHKLPTWTGMGGWKS
jgi:hypothetical protein